ncbi:MAG: ABC transporter transmembrane domain-containing protein, partial [Bacteroidales bacterium]
QNDSSDCGVAALASIAAYAGKELSLSHLRYLSGTDGSGTTVKGLLDAARSIGLSCEAYRGNLDSLFRAPKPMILHLKRERRLHFVVLTKLTPKGATIMDPAVGREVKVTKEELAREWSGIVLLFEQLKTRRGCKRRVFGLSAAARKRVGEIISQNRWLYPVTALISALSTATLLAITLFMKELIDKVLPAANLNELGRLSFSLILLSAVALASALGSSLFQLHCAIGCERRITKNFTKHLSTIALPYFKSFKIGEITSRLGDISRVRTLVTDTLPRLLISSLTIVLSLSILTFLSSRLTLIVLPALPLFMLLFIMHDRGQRDKMKRIMDEAAVFQSHFIENIKGIEVVRNYGMERLFLERSSSKHLALTSVTKESATLSIGASGVAQLFTRLLSIALLWVGGIEVVAGRVTVGEMVSFYTLFSMVTAPIAELASIFALLREGATALERLEDMLSIPSESSVEEGCGREFFNSGAKLERAREERSKWEIELKEIAFGYPGRELLFSNLSFKLQRGEIVALTGASGCGKSTLISLIMKHLSPTEGSIVGSFPYSNRVSCWRENIAVVPQNPTILGDTLMESILPNGVVGLEEEMVETVVEELQLEELASRFPSGFYSHPGEGGVLLSRGEQQRIAYARALLKGAPVMLLDEAVASLDSHSKGLIVESMFRVKREGGSILIVTHDHSLASLFDRIIDMEKFTIQK